MNATCANFPKGPALLAKAGVTLADAKWFYCHSRGGATLSDTVRLESIRRKVSSFLAQRALYPFTQFARRCPVRCC